jgi:hypothetical protein
MARLAICEDEVQLLAGGRASVDNAAVAVSTARRVFLKARTLTGFDHIYAVSRCIPGHIQLPRDSLVEHHPSVVRLQIQACAGGK